ncbi:MAG: glutaredoxin [Rhodocyclaceae bacterium]|nr:glutaredoxin [Rhodocyclaceae bacterium]
MKTPCPGVAGWARWLLLGLMLLAAPWLGAQERPLPGRPALEVFVRTGCPHCAAAKDYLTGLARERPGLPIVYRAVDQDPAALEDLIRYSREAGIWPPGVPTFRYGGQLLVGFDDAESSGPGIAALIDQALPAADQVETRWFGTLDASRLGLPAFTLALGLLDGFNPCATWVLLFLLSLLVRLKNRRRMALVAGTFVLASGAVYYTFMAAWLNVFLVLGMSEPLRWVLAFVALLIGAINVKDFFVWGQGPSLSIPATAKPGLYARMRDVVYARALMASLGAVTLLAILVNFFELLCTAGIPAIYTAVLTQQHLSPLAHYGYLGLYIVGYIADDTLMVALAVAALNSWKLTEAAGRRLKLLSGAVMLALGVAMIVHPEWLT